MFKRLAVAYLGVGFFVAVIQNWMAHVGAAASVFEVVFSGSSIGTKAQAVVDLVVIPLVAWPLRVWTMVRGG